MTADTQLKKIRDAIEKTPLLSPSASQLIEVTSSPGYELDDVLKVVTYDAPLTARVLRTINSPAYRLVREVESIDRAVAYLGVRVITSLAISDCASALFDKPLKGYEDQQGLWHHNLFCALASRAVARYARKPFGVDLAFTGGLLHDIGKGILSDFLQGTAGAALESISQGGAPTYAEAEQKIVGLDHAQVGFELAKSWKLPTLLQEVIRCHHHPSEADEKYRPFVYAVHLGDILAMMGGEGTGCDSLQYQLDARYTQYFDISEEGLARLLLEVMEEYRKISTSMAQ